MQTGDRFSTSVRAETMPCVLFVDPANYTPQYSVPLCRHLAAIGLSIHRAWQRALHADAEQPEFEFFRFSVRYRRWLSMTGRSLWRAIRGVEYLCDLFRLTHCVKRHHYSVIHFNWLVFPFLDHLFMRWLHNHGIAVVVTVHNLKPHDSGGISRYVIRAYRQADHLIALSCYIKDMLTSVVHVGDEKITVIPHGELRGYLPSYSHGEDNTPCGGRSSDSLLAVYLGAIRPYKGVPDLLRAWPMVIREVPGARLLIAGQMRKECRKEMMARLIALGDAASTVATEFTFLSPEIYQSHLQAATVLVQPYRSASQSGNTVHAYSCGVPVVCTRVGGLPEMVEEGVTGAVAEAGDIRSLATAIASILKANAHGEMKSQCLELAQMRYGWQNIERLVLGVYAKVISCETGLGTEQKAQYIAGVPPTDES